MFKKHHYAQVFQDAPGDLAQKIFCVLQEYAEPKSQCFSYRTFRAQIQYLLQENQEPTFQGLISSLSQTFNATLRNQIKPEGDFNAALSAIEAQSAILCFNRGSTHLPFVEVFEDIEEVVDAQIEPLEGQNVLDSQESIVGLVLPRNEFEDASVQEEFNNFVEDFFDALVSSTLTLSIYDDFIGRAREFESDGKFRVLDVLLYQDEAGNSALHKAIRKLEREDDLAIIERIIRDSLGHNKELKNKEGNTPLLKAALIKRIDIADCLIKLGADMLAKNNEHFTPAHFLKVAQRTPGRLAVKARRIEEPHNTSSPALNADRPGSTPIRNIEEIALACVVQGTRSINSSVPDFE